MWCQFGVLQRVLDVHVAEIGKLLRTKPQPLASLSVRAAGGFSVDRAEISGDQIASAAGFLSTCKWHVLLSDLTKHLEQGT
jgi:hypothetical protein